jgi:hypothetical protein
MRLENEVQQLQSSSSSSAPSVPRPTTASSVQSVRENIDQALRDSGLSLTEISYTLEQIYDLDPAWVRSVLENQRTMLDPLGCWLSNTASAHPRGYTKLNLRNTKRPDDPMRKIGCQPFFHQLAIVAKGEGAQLLNTATSEYEVSHLCHNGRCFNPDHLTVETQSLNHRRQRCAESYVVVCRCCGTTYHPCSHGREGMRLLCILPKYRLEPGKYHESGPNGPISF